MSIEQENLQKALILAGMPMEKAKITAFGYNFSKPKRSVSTGNCPRCGTKMIAVGMAEYKRRAMYCPKDRVVVPIVIE